MMGKISVGGIIRNLVSSDWEVKYPGLFQKRLH
jgi:hypothetical protein